MEFGAICSPEDVGWWPEAQNGPAIIINFFAGLAYNFIEEYNLRNITLEQKLLYINL